MVRSEGVVWIQLRPGKGDKTADDCTIATIWTND